MASEEVISCPTCRHALRVPSEWLGTEVQCPECQAMFRAPTFGPDGRLGDSVHLADATASLRRRTTNWVLIFPAIALIVTALASIVMNIKSYVQLENPSAEMKEEMFKQIQELRTKHKLFEDDPPDAKVRKQLDEQRVEQYLGYARSAYLGFCGLAIITAIGGVSIIMGRFYILGILGCFAAAINLANLCCLPGLVFGLWTFIVLVTEKGRAHFRRL